jgi:hypothetical protein
VEREHVRPHVHLWSGDVALAEKQFGHHRHLPAGPGILPLLTHPDVVANQAERVWS